MTKTEAKEAISQVLRKILFHDEKYWYEDKYIRWGKVERDLHKGIDSFIEEE